MLLGHLDHTVVKLLEVLIQFDKIGVFENLLVYGFVENRGLNMSWTLGVLILDSLDVTGLSHIEGHTTVYEAAFQIEFIL